jgi:hypothetical protein
MATSVVAPMITESTVDNTETAKSAVSSMSKYYVSKIQELREVSETNGKTV